MIKKKAPLFCRMRKHIIKKSPSAILFCGYGFKHRPKLICKKCPYKTENSLVSGLSEGLKRGLSFYLGEENAN